MKSSDLLTRLGSHSVSLAEYPLHFRRAATAILIHPNDEHLEMLFIRRAHHEEDPWSGHMALPGGGMDPEDQDALACAVRETSEEVGIKLGRSDSICSLQEIRGSARGKLLDLVVFPFVFFWQGDRTEVLANHEVAETVWVPVEEILDATRHTTFELSYQDKKVRMPCIEYSTYRIWGMTYRMLQNFRDAAGV